MAGIILWFMRIDYSARHLRNTLDESASSSRHLVGILTSAVSATETSSISSASTRVLSPGKPCRSYYISRYDDEPLTNYGLTEVPWGFRIRVACNNAQAQQDMDEAYTTVGSKACVAVGHGSTYIVYGKSSEGQRLQCSDSLHWSGKH